MPLQSELAPVGLLGDQPSTRLQRLDHLVERCCGVGQVHQQQPRVHEVVSRNLEVVIRNVVLAYLDVRRHPLEEARVQIAGDNDTRGPGLLSKPASDRACARSHLEAPPPRTHAEIPKMLDGRRVSCGFESAQPCPLCVVVDASKDVLLAMQLLVPSPGRDRTSPEDDQVQPHENIYQSQEGVKGRGFNRVGVDHTVDRVGTAVRQERKREPTPKPWVSAHSLVLATPLGCEQLAVRPKSRLLVSMNGRIPFMKKNPNGGPTSAATTMTAITKPVDAGSPVIPW